MTPCRRLAWLLAGGATALGATGCEGVQSSLDPASASAQVLADHWWELLLLSLPVIVVVTAALLFALSRRRAEPAVEDDFLRVHLTFAALGFFVPLIILATVMGLTLRAALALPGVNAGGGEAALRVEVAARNWWWEIRYPDHGVVTANEMHIPVGVPVEVIGSSRDVIHSFWVPRLHGKLDLVPGHETRMLLQADEPGTYRGQCAEFCGIQHANMIIFVVASEPGAFEEWLDHHRQPMQPVDDELVERGMEVFLTRACVNCHAVRGTEADATVGPDLTHLMDRERLAGGILPNTRADLATWIISTQAVKPGAGMPPAALSSEELRALLAFLEHLE